MKYLASLILALTLAVTASAGHGHNNVQAIVIQKNVQPRRATPFRRNDVIVQKQIIVDNGHNQNFRQQQRQNFNNHHHDVQSFRQAQYDAALLREALRQQQRQQINGDCHNDGTLSFRQNFNGGCQSLYR
jgi:hypothetical protein